MAIYPSKNANGALQPPAANTLSELKTSLAPAWGHLTDLIVEIGQGCNLYCANGRRLLDFTSGFGVTNTGHCHPRVVNAVQAQAERLLHGQINLVYHPMILELTETLMRVLPDRLDCFFFANSGAEAVESAVKLAHQATGRPNLIAFQNGFHGRTGLTMSLTTSKVKYRMGYQPLISGTFIAPYPNAYFYGWDREETSTWCLQQLRHMLHTQTAPEETAAIIVEAIQGEGGVIVAPDSFLCGLRDICDDTGMLLIVDEIQSGWGRSGRLFAYQYASTEPDILVMAKGMASGLPISAIAASRHLMDSWEAGSHGGTYNGNAVACAAAVASIRVIDEEHLADNAHERGEQLRRGLEEICTELGLHGEVRGRGLMVGVELTRADNTPDLGMVQTIQQGCLDRDVLVATAGPYGNVLRLLPPLVITGAQIEEGLSAFRGAARQACAIRGHRG